jgi:MFS superfamily sulfate permease-like transporter
VRESRIVAVWRPLIGDYYAARMQRALLIGLRTYVVLCVCIVFIVISPMLRFAFPYVLIAVPIGIVGVATFVLGQIPRARLGLAIARDVREQGHVINHAPALTSPRQCERWLANNELTPDMLVAASLNRTPTA